MKKYIVTFEVESPHHFADKEIERQAKERGVAPEIIAKELIELGMKRTGKTMQGHMLGGFDQTVEDSLSKNSAKALEAANEKV